MDNDKFLDKLCDHYKDTFEISKAVKERRDKCFIILCLLESASFLLVIDPQFIVKLFTDVLNKKNEIIMMIGCNVLQTTFWFFIAYVLIQYIQAVFNIERNYTYLHKLEQKIVELSDRNAIFNREGEHYVSDYPIVLNLIDLFYKMLCPLYFTAINVSHIIYEWKVGDYYLNILSDTMLCIIIFVLTWFYFFEIHNKISKWFKDNISFVNWLSMKLHGVLKKV